MVPVVLSRRTLLFSIALLTQCVLCSVAQVTPKSGFVPVGTSITCQSRTEDLGKALALSADGKRVAVGVPGLKIETIVVGAVRIFEFDGKTWKQLGSDLLSDVGVGTVGEAVALNARGDVVIIGSYNHTLDKGRAWVYKWRDGDWSLVGSALDGKAQGDRFARSVSINAEGNRIAIGASEASVRGAKSGLVSIYELKGTQWKLVGPEIPGKNYWTFAGTSVDLNAKGNVVAIGAPENDDHGNNAGLIEVFEFDGKAWIRRGDGIWGTAPESQCGHDLSLNSAGDVMVVGARFYGKNSEGQVRVFKYTSGKWQQVGEDIYGESNDHFGSVAINARGTRIAAGAWWSRSGGRLSGSVRVFDLKEGKWVQYGKTISGRELQVSGYAVGLSDDGSILAIGAPGPDPVGGGGPVGSVRVLRDQ